MLHQQKSGASWSPSSISYTGNNRTHMIRIPDPGRFELRLMDGSANPYLLQASVLAAGLYGLKNKLIQVNLWIAICMKIINKYPDLPKLPDELAQSLNLLKNNPGKMIYVFCLGGGMSMVAGEEKIVPESIEKNEFRMALATENKYMV